MIPNNKHLKLKNNRKKIRHWQKVNAFFIAIRCHSSKEYM